MFRIAFHLTDSCNLNCFNCHWFSDIITGSTILQPTDYINFINKHIDNIRDIRLTGGEPTLYPYFLELVNNIPEQIHLIICTNGTNSTLLQQITRPYNLVIGLNRPVEPDFKDEINQLNRKTTYINYTNHPENDEIIYSQRENLQKLIGKSCYCTSNLVRFGSDGWVYKCEIGLRTKDINYQTGLSLWNNAELLNNPIECTIQSKCLSNFLNENKYTLKND